MNSIRHRVSADDPQETRLDSYISKVLGGYSRSQLKAQLLRVSVNGREAKLSRKVRTGDELEIVLMDPASQDVLPEDILLDILYEDENVSVVNKPRGMVVHPAKGNYSGTLVNALLYRYRDQGVRFRTDYLRPGIVHRLDKDTSGVIIVTKNVETHDFIAEQFMKRKVRKLYLAIVKGEPSESVGRIETGIIRDPHNRKRFTWSATEGKKAVTFYRILKAFTGYTYVAYKPRTGRTHQIRVHSLYMQCPILGDPIYSRRDSRWSDAGLMLHSHRLALRIPGGQMPGGTKKVFKAPLPEEFKKALRILQKQTP